MAGMKWSLGVLRLPAFSVVSDKSLNDLYLIGLGIPFDGLVYPRL
jgi:hypothetical protein